MSSRLAEGWLGRSKIVAGLMSRGSQCLARCAFWEWLMHVSEDSQKVWEYVILVKTLGALSEKPNWSCLIRERNVLVHIPRKATG